MFRSTSSYNTHTYTGGSVGKCQGAGLMKLETHCNVVERGGSMTARGLIGILPGKPLYGNILNMTAEPMKLRKFMLVEHVSNAPTYIIHARDD